METHKPETYRVYHMLLEPRYAGTLLVAAEDPNEAVKIAEQFFYGMISIYGKCSELYSDIKGIVFNTIRVVQ